MRESELTTFPEQHADTPSGHGLPPPITDIGSPVQHASVMERTMVWEGHNTVESNNSHQTADEESGRVDDVGAAVASAVLCDGESGAQKEGCESEETHICVW